MKTVTIEVTIDGSSLYRNYQVDDLDNVTAETFGEAVAEMVETIKKQDEPL